MRTLKLTKDSQKNILESLLKRSLTTIQSMRAR